MLTTFLLFGATGDLAKRSLIPALFDLFKKGYKLSVIGVAIDKVDKEYILEQAKPFIQDFDRWEAFCKQVEYLPLDFTRIDDYYRLNEYLMTLKPSNRLLYCSSASTFFGPITQLATQAGILEKDPAVGWHRIAYEKPFGHDAKSAVKIQNEVKELLNDNQRFYIDHFLGKELVDNIIFIRFSNALLENSWNNESIKRVDIELHESLGVESRGAFFDSVGALLDVVQNHMLQMMSLVGMELPDSLKAEDIQKAKLAVLKNCSFSKGLLGQYSGYKEEIGTNSQTETFARLTMHINNKRWQGVPFYLRTGKALEKKETVIQITFKPLANPLANGIPQNRFTIEIEPNAGFELSLNAKKPGKDNKISCTAMNFCYPCEWPYNPNAYEVILEELLKGNHWISVTFEEILAAWHIIDTIKKAGMPLVSYEKGSMGPGPTREQC